MRASLFATCIADVFFPDAAADAVRLLRALGVEVDFPPGQTCCGQPALNVGQMRLARDMALHTRSVFAASEHVVLPSGSCATMLRHFYPGLLGDAVGAGGHTDGERGRDGDRGEDGSANARNAPGGAGHGPRHGHWHGHGHGRRDGAPAGGPRVWELAEFVLRALEVERLGRGLDGLRVAYHHGCHALRELGLRDEGPRLLEGAGARVVAWEACEECCGFGGLFSVKHPEVSVAMADRKLDTLPDADVLTSGDGGCLLQLGGRMQRRRMRLPVVPLASLLWRARNGAAG